jgi:hypothetical protein
MIWINTTSCHGVPDDFLRHSKSRLLNSRLSGGERGAIFHAVGSSSRGISGLTRGTLGFIALVVPFEVFYGEAGVVRKVVVGAFDDRELGGERAVVVKLCGWE